MKNESLASPSSPRTLPILVLVAVLAAAGGFAIGRSSATSEPGRAAPVPFESAGVREARSGEVIEALRIPDPFERAAWLGLELPKLGSGGVEEVRYALQSTAVDRGPAEYDLLVRRWAREDPAMAFSWSFTEAPKAHREVLIHAVAREWALRDPQSALREISSRPHGPATKHATEGLISGWVDSGAPGLGEFVYDIGYSPERQFAVSKWLRAIGQREGPQAIVDLAESIPDDDERYKRTVVRKAAAELTSLDPAFGVAWHEKYGAGPYGDTLLRIIAVRWVVDDGPATMEWLSRAEPGKRRDTALRDAFRMWRQRDRAGMLAWVDEMGIEGVEPWFEPAIGLYVMAVSVLDPVKAMAWTDLMTDSVKQRAARVTVARRWQRSDPEAAEAWIQASDLSEEDRRLARTPLPIKTSSRPYFEKLPSRSEESGDDADPGETSPSPEGSTSGDEAPID